MKNLAGVETADKTVLEELYLAGIMAVEEKSQGEVPYKHIGKIGQWTFRRLWYYWSVSVEHPELGLPLDKALELHNKKHPTENHILGREIRSGGDCGCPSPDEYVSQPVYDETLQEKLVALGYEKKYDKFLSMEYVPITTGEIARLCNEKKLDVERYVTLYHIDTQVGLCEFAKFLKENITL